MAFSKWKTTRFLGVHVHTAITCLGKFVSTWGPSADLKWIFLPVEKMYIYIYISNTTQSAKKKDPPLFLNLTLWHLTTSCHRWFVRSREVEKLENTEISPPAPTEAPNKNTGETFLVIWKQSQESGAGASVKFLIWSWKRYTATNINYSSLRVRGEVPPNAVSYIHVAFLWMGMQEGWVLVPDSVSLLSWSQLLQDSNQTDQCFLSKLCLWRMFRMGIDLSVYNHTGHLSDARTLSNPLCSKAAGLFLPVSGILFREW